MTLRVKPILLAVVFFAAVLYVGAQTDIASISGRVTDNAGALVVGAQLQLLSVERGTSQSTTTNGAGIYSFSSVRPGQYRMTVKEEAFRQVDLLGLVVNVQDRLVENFSLQVGSAAESITVNGNAPILDTEDASVSTVVDRNFAENLPLNGRSFQGLIELSPGVVVTPNNGFSTGQFSVNGQRASSNYWSVDGVSANIGTTAGTIPANGLAGAVGGVSVLGGTNSLVSIDALQEFRIATSTFAPEFGRTPGGQISISTRSGTNALHGSVFDYLRNDVLDANDWFADSLKLKKPEERQNDFGGTVGGAIFKDRAFFFFSYEGLRLRLPQTLQTDVPDASSRSSANPSMQPFLKAFPLPNGGPDPLAGPNISFFNASYSNRSTLDAYALRLDSSIAHNLNAFVRYDYSPSTLSSRGVLGSPLSSIENLSVNTQTATAGLDWSISPRLLNDVRVNYSIVRGKAINAIDDFGGAVPLRSLPFPAPFTISDSSLGLFFVGVTNGDLTVGRGLNNIQKQVNLVDTLSAQAGSHSLKMGVDFRRLAPMMDNWRYQQFGVFLSISDAETGSSAGGDIAVTTPTSLFFKNLGLFAQDTWRATSRLTMTYGLRWDIDFPPTANNVPLPAIVDFHPSNFSGISLAPSGTPLFNTSYRGFAPRIGVAYGLGKSTAYSTVLRGGFGVFYDLATSEIGSVLLGVRYPFGADALMGAATFPLSSGQATPPQISPPGPTSPLQSVDPNLKLPYTLEWNSSLEQALGNNQSITASYVGSAGRRLLQSVISLPPQFQFVDILTNSATSDYHALQLKFERHLSHGLQGLVSYTLAHSIDTASAGSDGNKSDLLSPGVALSSNRASSDFDIRHAFSAAATYSIPTPSSRWLAALLGGWSIENALQARTAPPVDIADGNFAVFTNGIDAEIRPDLAPNVPPYLFGAHYPGGKGFNPAAFSDPPSNANFQVLRQGTTPRNFLRGFGAVQWDFAPHREFHLREHVNLQFRAEMFNVINHPNFAPPDPLFGDPTFGRSTQVLSQSLSGTPGSGGFASQYQIGGPRSIQLSMKLLF